jgi:hypothetical protein
MNDPLNSQVVARCFTWAAMPGCPPVTDRGNFQHLLFSVKAVKAVMDHLPNAIYFRMNFTPAIL